MEISLLIKSTLKELGDIRQVLQPARNRPHSSQRGGVFLFTKGLNHAHYQN